MILYCDLETYSEEPIKHGAFKYAEHPSTKVLLWGYAIDDEPAHVWDLVHEPCPKDLLAAIETVRKDPDSRHVWHNGLSFDMNVITNCLPEMALPVEKIIDTMIIAYEHGLPGALGTLCEVMGLPQDKAKDKAGAALIRLFSVPRDDGVTPANHPQEWAHFVEYCRQDVEAERELYKRLPKVNCKAPLEHELMLLDARINSRGMLIDLDLARSAIEAAKRNKEALRGKTVELTNGALDSATRGAALIEFIRSAYGVELESLRKGQIERLITDDPEMPEEMRELLRIRLNAARTSATKYQVLLDCACEDGRLRGCLQFRGASRTGRWAGRLFQPQNLPRPSMKNDEVEEGIEFLKLGCADVIYENVEPLLASALRGAITVPKGKRMVVADYSNIEGRVLAWLAGETWKLEAFQEYDAGRGPDLYKLTYSKAFNVPVESVTKPQRQLGKILELAMGYGGGVGAFKTFALCTGVDLDDMAKAVLPVVPPNVLSDAEYTYGKAATNPERLKGLDHDAYVACESVKRLWRAANPKIVLLWNHLEDATVSALVDRAVVRVPRHHGLEIRRVKGWLLIKLPSGRYLCYPQALRGTPDDACAFSYMGMLQQRNLWTRLKTYGGKITENIVQAIAADLLGHAFFQVEEAGFAPILSIHDEILTEAPDDPEHDHKALERAMTRAPYWAVGLPLAAEGFESYRYRKG